MESNLADLTTNMHLAQMTADQTKTGSTMAGMTVRLIEMEPNSAERTAHLTTKAMHLAQMTADQTKTGSMKVLPIEMESNLPARTAHLTMKEEQILLTRRRLSLLRWRQTRQR